MRSLMWVAVALACAALPAAAQEGPLRRSDTRGLGVGLSLDPSRVGVAGPDVRLGLGLSGTYGVGERVSLFTRYGVGYGYAHLDAGVRYTFRGPTSAPRPYLELGATRLASRSTMPLSGEPARSSGYGVMAAAGAEYFLTPRLALDAGVSHSEGRVSRTEIGGTERPGSPRVSATRVNVGFRWRP